MYGLIPLPFKRAFHDLEIEISSHSSHYHYTRTQGESVYQKKVIAQGGAFYLEPIEPVYQNIKLSRTLMIELSEALILSSGANQQLYLTFPIEMMVSWRDGKRTIQVDTFTLLPRKLALYGDPSQGVLCHYWKSRAEVTPPKTDKLFEGVLALTLQNSTERPIEVTQAIFSADGMKLYYDQERVLMSAQMVIRESGVAETSFLARPPQREMIEAQAAITSRGLLSGQSRFAMEYGL